jgi:hypothetical protein
MNVVSTCAKCHENSSARFAQYFVHADRRDRESYPQVFWAWTIMVSVMTGVFGFFGSHTILWLIRSLAEGRRGAAGEGTGASPERVTDGGPAPGDRRGAPEVAGEGESP